MNEMHRQRDPIPKHTIGRMQRAKDNIDVTPQTKKIKYPNGVFQLNGNL